MGSMRRVLRLVTAFAFCTSDTRWWAAGWRSKLRVLRVDVMLFPAATTNSTPAKASRR
jgi:hypothetical protein